MPASESGILPPGQKRSHRLNERPIRRAGSTGSLAAWKASATRCFQPRGSLAPPVWCERLYLNATMPAATSVVLPHRSVLRDFLLDLDVLPANGFELSQTIGVYAGKPRLSHSG